LGNGRKHPAAAEEQGRLSSRRSIVAAVDIRRHEIINPGMLTCKRPAGGLDPREFDRLIGCRTRRDLARDSMLDWADVMPPSGSGAGAEAISDQQQPNRPRAAEALVGREADA